MNQGEMKMFKIDPIDILESRWSARIMRIVLRIMIFIGVFVLLSKLICMDPGNGFWRLIPAVLSSLLLMVLICDFRLNVNHLEIPEGLFLFVLYKRDEQRELVVAYERGYRMVPKHLWAQTLRDQTYFTLVRLQNPWVISFEVPGKSGSVTFALCDNFDSHFHDYITGLAQWHRQNFNQDQTICDILVEAGRDFIAQLEITDLKEATEHVDEWLKPFGYCIDDYRIDQSVETTRHSIIS